jgi:hypothetical protein
MIANLIAFPYMLLFFAVWIFSSLARPVLVLSLFCVTSKPAAAFRKFQLFLTTVRFMLLSKDKSWKRPKDDPQDFFELRNDVGVTNVDSIRKKSIIFVRHGESTWNDTFNKGDRSKFKFALLFVPNLVYAFYVEWYFWVTGASYESWFYDSPLSEKGLKQALGVQSYLSTTKVEFLTPRERAMVEVLLGTSKVTKSQLVSSNLRRAISTMLLGFQDRLRRNGDERVQLLSCLQEISRNPDALSITPARGKALPSWTEPDGLQYLYDRVDTSRYDGNKSVDSNGLVRLDAFCQYAFKDEATDGTDAIVAAGHSLWFRSFFQVYLPYEVDHVAKKKKLINGGIVGFTLERIETKENTFHYRIDPKSITTLHGGF